MQPSSSLLYLPLANSCSIQVLCQTSLKSFSCLFHHHFLVFRSIFDMEQAQYWMWMRKRQVLKSHFQVSMNSLSESWEEKAFAEDAAGSSGSCIWPPRSYSCSFCRREFKSAQALGGHMNVHRRDRARLKQSLSHTNSEDVVPRHQNHNQTNDLDQNSIASTFSASRISALSSQQNFDSTNNSSSVQDTTAKRSLSNVISGSKAEAAEKSIKPVVEEDSVCLGSDRVETNLSVGLNSVFFHNLPTVSCGEEAISCNKRPKINAVSTLPFFVSKESACSPHQWQVLGLKPAAGSMDDLDLELRLGSVLPKVK